MSDFPEASDWWKASDERWYAPPPSTDGTPPATASTPAEARSADREAAEKKTGRLLLGLALVFVLIVAFSMSSSGGGSDDDPAPAPTGPTMAGAEDVCTQAVKDQLKAPAGANVEVQGQSVSGSRYTLTGVVDSENSFGANVRANWACTATHVSGASWRTNATVDG